MSTTGKFIVFHVEPPKGGPPALFTDYGLVSRALHKNVSSENPLIYHCAIWNTTTGQWDKVRREIVNSHDAVRYALHDIGTDWKTGEEPTIYSLHFATHLARIFTWLMASRGTKSVRVKSIDPYEEINRPCITTAEERLSFDLPQMVEYLRLLGRDVTAYNEPYGTDDIIQLYTDVSHNLRLF